MKRTLKAFVAVMLVSAIAVGLTACGGTAKIKMADVTIFTYDEGVRSAALTGNAVKMEKDTIVVTVANPVDEVEINLKQFFDKNKKQKEMLGGGFRFTRSDSNKTGYGLECVSYVAGTSNHLWRKYGETHEGKLKTEYSEILRMYDFGQHAGGGIVIYADSTTGSTLKTATYPIDITYHFTGNNGHKATLKLKIVKTA